MFKNLYNRPHPPNRIKTFREVFLISWETNCTLCIYGSSKSEKILSSKHVTTKQIITKHFFFRLLSSFFKYLGLLWGI